MAINISGERCQFSSCGWNELTDRGLEKERGYRWPLNHSVISPSMEDRPCMFNAPFWKAFGSRTLQLTPSVHHLVLHYPQPVRVPCGTKELMILFVLLRGTQPKQMTTTNPSNLAALSTSAVFASPPEAWNAHIAHRPPKQQAALGVASPSVAREDLINEWS